MVSRSGWNLWVSVESTSLASWCGCKVVYIYIYIDFLIPTPLVLILLFFGSCIPIFVHFLMRM